jgi:hypothetical protein
VGVCFTAALPVDFLVTFREVNQQMRSGVIVTRATRSLEYVNQAHPVTVHNQPKSLLCGVCSDKMYIIPTCYQVTGKTHDSSRCFAASWRSLKPIKRSVEWTHD